MDDVLSILFASSKLVFLKKHPIAPAIRNQAGGPDRDYLVWDHGLYTVQRAVRTKQHLMIKTYDQLDYQQFEPTALYDMEADPYQSTNIANEHPDVVAQCETYLATWLDEQHVKPSHVSDPLDAIVAERVQNKVDC